MDAQEFSKNRESSLREKLKQDSSDIVSRLELALLLSGVSRDVEAAEQYNLALQFDPGSPEVIAMYSRFLLSRKRTDEAISLTDSALEINPMESVLLKAHATALHSLGEYEAAIDELQLARQMIDDDPALDYLLVECLIANGDHDEAYSCAQGYCLEYPQCTTRMHSAGRVCWAKGDYVEALDYLNKALEIIPNSLNILLDLCGVLGDQDKRSDAIDLLKKKSDFFVNSAEYHYALGNLYADENQPEVAMKMYTKAVALNPTHFHALNNLALILQEREAPSDEIETFFKRALDANPDDVFANLNYGNFLLGKGRREEAIPHYHKVVEKEPWYIQARLAYAQTLLELGRADEALQAMKNLADDEELSDEERVSLAKLYLRVNQEEQAERILKDIVKESKGNSFSALEALGDFMMEKGRAEEAIKLYLRAILIEPSDPAIWIKAVGYLIESRNLFEVAAEIEVFLFEVLPALCDDEDDEDELITVFKVLNEAIASNDPDRLSTFVEAAWEMKQSSLLAVLAKLHGFFGDVIEAERTFSEALRISPWSDAICREYVGWLISLNRFQQAKELIEDFLKEYHDEPSLENDLALVIFSLGEVTKAQQMFFSLSKRYPLDITYIYNYAWILYKNGMADIALEVIDGYLERVAFDEKAAFFAAQMIAETRNRNAFPKARRYINLVLSNNDRNHNAWSLSGWMYQELGELKNAAFSFKKALLLAPDSQNVLLSASSFHLSVLQFSEASKWLTRFSANFEHSEEFLVELARMFQATEKYKSSIDPLRQLYSIDSEKYGFLLACSLHYVGEKEEASSIVTELISTESKATSSIAAAWYYFISGNCERALEIATSSMTDASEIVDFRNLSIYLLSVGDIEKSYEALKIFISFVTQPLDIYFFLRDLDDYHDRFSKVECDRFRLELSIKLRDMLADFCDTEDYLG